MTHPTKAQVQTVIDNLSKMVPSAQSEHSLCMLESSLCGTVHCHGGWYYLAKTTEVNEDHNYFQGANMMAEDLGFRHSRELKDWAGTNSDIWGNDEACDMFVDAFAFISESRPDGALTLQHIVDHWKEVQSRLPE